MIASRATTQATQSRLQDFYNYRGTTSLTEKSYFVVRGEDITYLFDGSENSTEFISEIVNNGMMSRRIGAHIIRYTRHLPLLFHIVPNLEIFSIPVPKNRPPGLIILRSRISMIDFNDNTVYKFPIQGNLNMDAAIKTRRKLPSEVNAPELIEVDRTFPFIHEELISGRTVRSTIESWPQILSALNNLKHLYRSHKLEYIPVENLLSTINETHDEEIVRQTLQELKNLSLPNSLAVGQIHGDLSVRNLRYDSESVYILDWQDSRQDLLIHDFFRPIYRIASKSDQPEIFTQMIAGVGKPSDIAKEYSLQIGPLAFKDKNFHDGLPLLYLLCALDSPTIGVGNWWADTVQVLLDELNMSNHEK